MALRLMSLGGVLRNLTAFLRDKGCRLSIAQHLRIREAIADVHVSEQIDRLRRIVLDLLPELSHEGPEILHFFPTVSAPNRRQQLRIRNHPSCPAHQAVENVELLTRQMHRLPTLGYAALRRNELDLANLNRSVLRTRRRMNP